MTSGLGKGIRDALDRIEKEGIRVPAVSEPVLTPEQQERAAFQLMREADYFHPSSWYMRVWTRGYDGYGCTYRKCITSCPYFSATGRLHKENGKEIITYDDEKPT